METFFGEEFKVPVKLQVIKDKDKENCIQNKKGLLCTFQGSKLNKDKDIKVIRKSSIFFCSFLHLDNKLSFFIYLFNIHYVKGKRHDEILISLMGFFP